MILQLVSDCHLEFHEDEGTRFLANLDPTGVDILVVAGDLCSSKLLDRSLTALCATYPEVIYVLGNHEFYHKRREALFALMTELVDKLPNLHWLENRTVSLNGFSFTGSTMWFPDLRGADPLGWLKASSCMTDFHAIPEFSLWFGEANNAWLKFAKRQIHKGDVVITHHLPSKKCVPPIFKDSELNRFFVCPMDALIKQIEPPLWLFGHTHDSVDTRLGKTRLLCNPLGYRPDELNPQFIEKLTVTL